jgi:hypothetical protein
MRGRKQISRKAAKARRKTEKVNTVTGVICVERGQKSLADAGREWAKRSRRPNMDPEGVRLTGIGIVTRSAAEGFGVFLLRGVTGIATRKEGSPSFTDYQAFCGHCYEAARQVGGSVQAVLAPRQTMACNYALALIGLHEETVAVLLNGVLPLLAFAVPPADGQIRLHFIDRLELAAEFERLGGYTVLSATNLNQPLLREMCRELAPHEQKRVKYFRPQRVGDVVFNHWD